MKTISLIILTFVAICMCIGCWAIMVTGSRYDDENVPDASHDDCIHDVTPCDHSCIGCKYCEATEELEDEEKEKVD